jgi:hypothetical protein
MQLRVKDLQRYLVSKHVNTVNCVGKNGESRSHWFPLLGSVRASQPSSRVMTSCHNWQKMFYKRKVHPGDVLEQGLTLLPHSISTACHICFSHGFEKCVFSAYL